MPYKKIYILSQTQYTFLFFRTRLKLSIYVLYKKIYVLFQKIYILSQNLHTFLKSAYFLKIYMLSQKNLCTLSKSIYFPLFQNEAEIISICILYQKIYILYQKIYILSQNLHTFLFFRRRLKLSRLVAPDSLIPSVSLIGSLVLTYFTGLSRLI